MVAFSSGYFVRQVGVRLGFDPLHPPQAAQAVAVGIHPEASHLVGGFRNVDDPGDYRVLDHREKTS